MRFEAISDCITDKISGEWGSDSLDSIGTRVIRTANFTNEGRIDFSNIVFRKIPSHKIEKKKLLSGDVIIEKSGGSPTQPVGRVVFFENPNNEICLCNNFTAILRPNLQKVYPKYLFYALFFNHKKGRTLKYQNKTTGIINLKIDNYLKSSIPTPHINDQIRIATLLSRVEALIATCKENLHLLDEFLKSTFLEMFGDPVRNAKAFEVRTLSEFYVDPKNGTKCGPFGSALKKKEYVKSGVPVWNMDNISIDGRLNPEINLWITDEKFEELKGYSTITGDVIISRAGTVGKMCVLNSEHPKSIISTNLIRVRFGEELLPIFFVSLMTYCKGRVGKLRTGADGSFTHMNTGILDNLNFPYPPIELQRLFSSIVNKVESIKTLYKKNLTELENLYGALGQKAFKGELDLSRIPLKQEFELQMDANGRELESGAPLFSPMDHEVMSDPVARKRLLRQIFKDYLTEDQSRSFSFRDFWPRIESNVLDYMDEESPPLGAADYNKIKEWLFDRLKSGQIEQWFNEAKNQMELCTKP